MSLDNCKIVSQEPLEIRDAKWVKLVKYVSCQTIMHCVY